MTRNRTLGPAATAVVALAVVLATATAQDTDPECEWVEKVVLRPKFIGAATETGAFQWVKGQPLNVSVTGGTKEHRKAVAAVVDDFHAAIKGTPLKGMKLLPAGAGGTTVMVNFMPKARIPAALAQAGWPAKDVKLWEGDKQSFASQVFPYPTSKYVTARSLIFVSSDAADAGEVEWGVALSVAASLGVQFTSDYKESGFFGGAEGGPRLKAADRRLLAWYYTHVPPGTKEIGPLYAKHYPKGK
ncbi:MAG: hypothetical protein U0804_22405 [Gemmataceae bacterium]